MATRAGTATTATSHGTDGPLPRRWIAVGIVAVGVALVVLVVRDGSPPWQATRVVAVAATTVLLVAAAARRAPRPAGWLAVGVGVPAAAIAVGFAPHWVKRGPLLIQVPAAVLAVAALGLLVGGTVAASQGRRWWHRTASAGGVVVALAITTFVVGVPVAATNVPRPAIGARPGSAGLDAIDVELRTSDGVGLSAWYVPSANGAAVVLLHGAGSTRSDVLDHAAVLADAGFGVLAVDARGHGESDGRAMDLGWAGDADIAAATRFLASRPDVARDRIGAVGISMGGEEAIGASGSDPLIRAVVAEGATARTAADETWLSERYGLRGLVQEQLERLQDGVTDVLTSEPPPTALRDAIAASPEVRYLLIAAGRVADEEHAAAHVASAAPDRVTVWTVPGAGHTDGLDVAPDEWTTRVVGFLATALAAPRTS